MPEPVVWITGRSGAGKSTVARVLVERMRAAGASPVLLDGDELRAALGAHGYDDASRRELAFAYARLARMLAAQGHPIVCAVIALFHDVHAWSREHVPGYFEVLLHAPLEELRRRDPKGLYRADPRGRDLVGVSRAAELPVGPDLVIRNWRDVTPEAAAELIARRCPGLRGLVEA